MRFGLNNLPYLGNDMIGDEWPQPPPINPSGYICQCAGLYVALKGSANEGFERGGQAGAMNDSFGNFYPYPEVAKMAFSPPDCDIVFEGVNDTNICEDDCRGYFGCQWMDNQWPIHPDAPYCPTSPGDYYYVNEVFTGPTELQGRGMSKGPTNPGDIDITLPRSDCRDAAGFIGGVPPLSATIDKCPDHWEYVSLNPDDSCFNIKSFAKKSDDNIIKAGLCRGIIDASVGLRHPLYDRECWNDNSAGEPRSKADCCDRCYGFTNWADFSDSAYGHFAVHAQERKLNTESNPNGGQCGSARGGYLGGASPPEYCLGANNAEIHGGFDRPDTFRDNWKDFTTFCASHPPIIGAGPNWTYGQGDPDMSFGPDFPGWVHFSEQNYPHNCERGCTYWDLDHLYWSCDEPVAQMGAGPQWERNHQSRFWRACQYDWNILHATFFMGYPAGMAKCGCVAGAEPCCSCLDSTAWPCFNLVPPIPNVQKYYMGCTVQNPYLQEFSKRPSDNVGLRFFPASGTFYDVNGCPVIGEPRLQDKSNNYRVRYEFRKYNLEPVAENFLGGRLGQSQQDTITIAAVGGGGTDPGASFSVRIVGDMTYTVTEGIHFTGTGGDDSAIIALTLVAYMNAGIGSRPAFPMNIACQVAGCTNGVIELEGPDNGRPYTIIVSTTDTSHTITLNLVTVPPGRIRPAITRITNTLADWDLPLVGLACDDPAIQPLPLHQKWRVKQESLETRTFMLHSGDIPSGMGDTAWEIDRGLNQHLYNKDGKFEHGRDADDDGDIDIFAPNWYCEGIALPSIDGRQNNVGAWGNVWNGISELRDECGILDMWRSPMCAAFEDPITREIDVENCCGPWATYSTVCIDYYKDENYVGQSNSICVYDWFNIFTVHLENKARFIFGAAADLVGLYAAGYEEESELDAWVTDYYKANSESVFWQALAHSKGEDVGSNPAVECKDQTQDWQRGYPYILSDSIRGHGIAATGQICGLTFELKNGGTNPTSTYEYELGYTQSNIFQTDAEKSAGDMGDCIAGPQYCKCGDEWISFGPKLEGGSSKEQVEDFKVVNQLILTRNDIYIGSGSDLRHPEYVLSNFLGFNKGVMEVNAVSRHEDDGTATGADGEAISEGHPDGPFYYPGEEMISQPVFSWGPRPELLEDGFQFGFNFYKKKLTREYVVARFDDEGNVQPNAGAPHWHFTNEGQAIFDCFDAIDDDYYMDETLGGGVNFLEDDVPGGKTRQYKGAINEFGGVFGGPIKNKYLNGAGVGTEVRSGVAFPHPLGEITAMVPWLSMSTGKVGGLWWHTMKKIAAPGNNNANSAWYGHRGIGTSGWQKFAPNTCGAVEILNIGEGYKGISNWDRSSFLKDYDASTNEAHAYPDIFIGNPSSGPWDNDLNAYPDHWIQARTGILDIVVRFIEKAVHAQSPVNNSSFKSDDICYNPGIAKPAAYSFGLTIDKYNEEGFRGYSNLGVFFAGIGFLPYEGENNAIHNYYSTYQALGTEWRAIPSITFHHNTTWQMPYEREDLFGLTNLIDVTESLYGSFLSLIFSTTYDTYDGYGYPSTVGEYLPGGGVSEAEEMNYRQSTLAFIPASGRLIDQARRTPNWKDEAPYIVYNHHHACGHRFITPSAIEDHVGGGHEHSWERVRPLDPLIDSWSSTATPQLLYYSKYEDDWVPTEQIGPDTATFASYAGDYAITVSGGAVFEFPQNHPTRVGKTSIQSKQCQLITGAYVYFEEKWPIAPKSKTWFCPPSETDEESLHSSDVGYFDLLGGGVTYSVEGECPNAKITAAGFRDFQFAPVDVASFRPLPYQYSIHLTKDADVELGPLLNDNAYFKVFDWGRYRDVLANTLPYRFDKLVVEDHNFRYSTDIDDGLDLVTAEYVTWINFHGALKENRFNEDGDPNKQWNLFCWPTVFNVPPAAAADFGTTIACEFETYPKIGAARNNSMYDSYSQCPTIAPYQSTMTSGSHECMQNRFISPEIQPGGGRGIPSNGIAAHYYDHESEYISTFTFLEEGWLYSNGGQADIIWPEGPAYIAAQVESGANGDLAGIAGLAFWERALDCEGVGGMGSYYPSQLSTKDGTKGSYPPGMNPDQHNEHQVINFSVTHPNRGFFKMAFKGFETEPWANCPSPEAETVNFGNRQLLDVGCCTANDMEDTRDYITHGWNNWRQKYIIEIYPTGHVWDEIKAQYQSEHQSDYDIVVGDIASSLLHRFQVYEGKWAEYKHYRTWYPREVNEYGVTIKEPGCTKPPLSCTSVTDPPCLLGCDEDHADNFSSMAYWQIETKEVWVPIRLFTSVGDYLTYSPESVVSSYAHGRPHGHWNSNVAYPNQMQFDDNACDQKFPVIVKWSQTCTDNILGMECPEDDTEVEPICWSTCGGPEGAISWRGTSPPSLLYKSWKGGPNHGPADGYFEGRGVPAVEGTVGTFWQELDEGFRTDDIVPYLPFEDPYAHIFGKFEAAGGAPSDLAGPDITNYGAPCETNRWARTGPEGGAGFGSFTLDLLTGMSYQIKVTKYREKFLFYSKNPDVRGWRDLMSSLPNSNSCCNIHNNCMESDWFDLMRGPHEVTMVYQKTYDFNTSALLGYDGQMEMMRDDKMIFDVRGPNGGLMGPTYAPAGHGPTGSIFSLPYWERGELKKSNGYYEAENISCAMPTNKHGTVAHAGLLKMIAPHAQSAGAGGDRAHPLVEDYVTLSLDEHLANETIE